MKRLFFLSALLLFVASTSTFSSNPNPTFLKQQTSELDEYWKKLSKTVKEGDFEGYSALYHDDAVVIFTTGDNKISRSISETLSSWKQGFDNTKAGKQKDNVEFRFSQSISNTNTAHVTGIFHFTSVDNSGKVLVDILVHFEMLFVKKDGKWLATMEYQKSNATKAEWEALS